MSGNKQTCFVLGAGFSIPAGLPSQAGILPLITKAGIDLSPVKKIFNISSDKELNNIPLEDIFTFFDRAINNNDSVLEYDLKDLYDAKYGLIDGIVKVFNADLSKTSRIPEYAHFFDALVTRKLAGTTNSIITINWDTLPDWYIAQSFKKLLKSNQKGGVDYTCFDWDFDEKYSYKASILRKENGYKTIKVIKIHGSLNWVYNKLYGGLYIQEQTGARPKGIELDNNQKKEYENIMITPTFLKNFDNAHLKMIWQNAGHDLREADRIVFLGYSLPLSDFDFRYLLLKSIAQNDDSRKALNQGRVKIRVLLHPKDAMCEVLYNRKETEKRYKDIFAGRDIDVAYGDTKDFLVDDYRVWDW
jgi:NAD-dependent SIR2 family protein deacetylase